MGRVNFSVKYKYNNSLPYIANCQRKLVGSIVMAFDVNILVKLGRVNM